MKNFISLQLYSVRDCMANDFEGTLKRVSELGYQGVEPAGFFGKSAEEVKELLQKYNLTLTGTHSGFDDLVNNYEETVAYHKILGNKNYIIPGYPMTNQEQLDYFIKNANLISKKLEADGITLGYHNHSKEFYINADGSVAYEQLIYRTDIKLQLDTYWAFVGMKNPITMMDRISDRLMCIHLKDGSVDGLGAGRGMPLGKGVAPVKEVWAKAIEMNVPIVVESETLNPDGLTEAEICINYLKELEK